MVISSVLERIFLCRKHLGTREKPSTCPNSFNIIQTTKWFIKGCMVRTLSSRAASLTTDSPIMSSSSNSSPSCPGCLNSQHFCHVFPAALPRSQHNILYTAVLQQPFLVADLERQSSCEEDDSIQSLIRVFHHLCSTQIYLGSLEPHTDHITSSTLHIAAALNDTLDLLHDHRIHHHVLSLPPNNITLAHIFHCLSHPDSSGAGCI